MSGWYPDPTGRFEYRYHNDRDWTADVASHGQRFVDPLPPPSSAGVVPPPPPAGGGGGNGLAVAAMVCGIVAITIAWIPFLGVLGLIAAVVALALGIPAIMRSRAGAPRGGMAIAGVITGSIGLVLGVVGIVLSVIVLRAVQRFDDPGPLAFDVTSCVEEDGDFVATGYVENLSDSERDYTVLVRLGPGVRERVEVDDVPPGARGEFVARERAAGGGPDCRVESVDGPIPFGLDPNLFED